MINNEPDKHFKKLILSNELIQTIEDNDFDEIGFDEIKIENCRNLKQIHWNAFGKQSKIVKKFVAYSYSNKLPNLISKPKTDYDLYKLVNSLVNCQEIRMKPFNNKLQFIKLNKLKILDLDGQKSSTKIKSICDFALYECDQIEVIYLMNNEINFIEENSFYIKNCSTKTLLISLSNNNLNECSFAPNSFNNFKRQVNILLYLNCIKYLKQDIFRVFLNNDKNNSIHFLKIILTLMKIKINGIKMKNMIKELILNGHILMMAGLQCIYYHMMF